MYMKLSQLFWLRPDTKTKSELLTVSCRITLDGKRIEVSTGYKVLAKDWNQGKQEFRRKSEDYNHYNGVLTNIKYRLNDLRCRSNLPPSKPDLVATVKQCLGMFKVADAKSFEDYVPAMLASKEDCEKRTLQSMTNRTQKVVTMLGGDAQVPLSTLKHEVWQNMVDELNKHYEPGYVKKIWDMVLAVYATAKRYDSVSDDAIQYVKMRAVKPKAIVHLTDEELDKWTSAIMPSERLSQVQDLFTFQCYTGISVADLKQLTGRNIKIVDNAPVLHYRRQKTKKRSDRVSQIPLLPKALEVWNRYDGKFPTISDQKYNQYLKEVASIIGIKKVITTHVGRKTCATWLHSVGMPLDMVKEILGHSDVAITKAHYASQTGHYLKNELSRLGLLPAVIVTDLRTSSASC